MLVNNLRDVVGGCKDWWTLLLWERGVREADPKVRVRTRLPNQGVGAESQKQEKSRFSSRKNNEFKGLGGGRKGISR